MPGEKLEERAEAATYRKSLHMAIARQDLDEMRSVIHQLYVAEESPLKAMGEVKRMETYAPMIEAAIVARVYVPGTPVCKEMMLNFEHTHAKFGVATTDYESIMRQLEDVDAGGSPQEVDWCAGTALHGRVKPFRHARLFSRSPQDTSGGE